MWLHFPAFYSLQKRREGEGGGEVDENREMVGRDTEVAGEGEGD